MMPDYWFRNWSGKGEVILVEDGWEAHRGAKCVKATTGISSREKFPVKPGEQYRCRVWARTTGDKAALRIIFVRYRRIGERKLENLPAVGFDRPATPLTGRWQVYEGIYTVPADSDRELLGILINVGDAVIDDVSLRLVNAAP